LRSPVSLYNLINRIAGRFGLDVRPSGMRYDFDPEAVSIIRRVRAFTMTPPERLFAMIQAARYVSDAGLPGAIVEAGVWRGGSMMAAALSVASRGDTARDLYLYDTYEGMSEPGTKDVDLRGKTATEGLSKSKKTTSSEMWGYSPIEEVRRNLLATGYPADRLHFVIGKVEDTIPREVPERIALLRLDTDWYESTKHEMQHLYPLLASAGVLILDDYGHWQGARSAVDEYLEANGLHLLLNRIDASGRLAIKP
jgi:O-methyltransferase